jgi:uncharacterized protein YceK
MKAKRLIWLAAIGSVVILAGCGTIGARATTRNPPPFAGLRSDFENIGAVFTNKEEIKPVWVYWLAVPLVSGIILADIPVSTVFDLYCLPVDLSRHEKYADEVHVTIERNSSDLNGGYIQDSIHGDGQN